MSRLCELSLQPLDGSERQSASFDAVARALRQRYTGTREPGYDMLWQGAPDQR